MLKQLYLFLFFFFLMQADMLLAQTKYEGFGAVTRGGKGGKTIHVKNLNADGEGSLRAAIGSNRTIVFDVAGTINNFKWDSSDEFSINNLTIDGSTAPSPGITLNNNNNGDGLSFQDNCHDIIVKNIRMRNAGNDGFSVVRNAYNIIFDHCSSSGNRDGNLDITAGAYNVTVQYCILGGGAPNTHGYSGTMLIGYSPVRNISIHHNLFSPSSEGNVGERSPMINWIDGATPPPSTLVCDFRNNIVWKWGRNNGTGSGYATAVCYKATANIINNYYYSGVFPENATNTADGYGNGGTGQAYMSGNVSGNKEVNPNSPGNHTLFDIPSQNTPATQDACTAAVMVLAQAGPRPLDATDQALINAVSLINCPAVKNQLPTANAGVDIIITLPKNSVALSGSGADTDGKISGYTWSKVSGPLTYTLKNLNASVATVSNLVPGTYIFRLTVTDNKGGRATDDVTLTVKPAKIPHKK